MKRYSRHITATARWRRLRQQILVRDEYLCQHCGRHSPWLEVDHIKPVRTYPQLAFDPGNLQTLCRQCHASKTRKEIGFTPIHPERQKWRNLLSKKETKYA